MISYLVWICWWYRTMILGCYFLNMTTYQYWNYGTYILKLTLMYFLTYAYIIGRALVQLIGLSPCTCKSSSYKTFSIPCTGIQLLYIKLISRVYIGEQFNFNNNLMVKTPVIRWQHVPTAKKYTTLHTVLLIFYTHTYLQNYYLHLVQVVQDYRGHDLNTHIHTLVTSDAG